MSGKKEFEYKSMITREAAAMSLRFLADSFEAGALSLEKGARHITLSPADDLFIEIEAATKKDKSRIEIEISWSNRAPEPDRAGELLIGMKTAEDFQPTEEEAGMEEEQAGEEEA